VRENKGILGNLTSDFDFTQAPRPPMLLAVHPITTLTATVPFSPVTPTVTPGNGQATLTWQKPSSDGGARVKGYVITPFADGHAQAPESFSSTARKETIVGLVNGDIYSFTVAARNDLGIGYPSVATRPTRIGVPTAPAPPSTSPRDHAVTLSWDPPAQNDGSRVIGYVVTAFIGSVAQTAHTFHTAARTETITGLANGRTYTFTLAALNANGPGPRSDPSTKVVPGTPLAPTHVTAVALPQSGAVTLSWRAPTSTNGAAIKGYIITPYIGTRPRGHLNVRSTNTRHIITHLRPGTTYSFKVAASNAYGTGPRSRPSNLTKPT